jgi:hypothetical protein
VAAISRMSGGEASRRHQREQVATLVRMWSRALVRITRGAGRGSAGSAAGVGARGIRWGATVPDGAAQLRAEAGERPAVRRKKKETALSTAR